MRVVPLRPRPRSQALLYTDATGGGDVAWVLHWGSLKVYAQALVPRWLRRWVCNRKTQIATWELVAALCGLWHVLGMASDQEDPVELHLFIDSSVALGTLLRGCSRQRDWNHLVFDVWFNVAASGMLLMAWRVPSKQNLADAPTRPVDRKKEMALLHEAGFREVEWRWPDRAPWIA